MKERKVAIITVWRQLLTWLMIPIIVMGTGPSPYALAQGQSGSRRTPPRRSSSPAIKTKAKTGPHKVLAVEKKVGFSQDPTDLEISSARVFQEPLAAMTSPAVEGENKALAQAILALKKNNNIEDLTPFTKFLAQVPKSRWRASLELNIGLLRFQSGYLSQSLSLWKSAWDLSKSETGKAQRAVADRAIAELLLANARLGNVKDMRDYLAQIKNRPILGSNEEKVRSAREGLACMLHRPEVAFKCGPYAVGSILNIGKPIQHCNPTIRKAASSSQGTNLLQVKQLADQVGLKYQMARRSKDAPIIVPSVMHWNVGHFAAITAKKNGHYQVKDPTFGIDGNRWLTADALNSETDGFSLVPAGQLPKGWEAVSDQNAKLVWGKGFATGFPDNYMSDGMPSQNMSGGGRGPRGPGKPCNCKNMAEASAWSAQANLNIQDIPLSYAPPIGPNIDFKINYNFNEVNQPATFTFSNLGPDWTFNWLSYLTVDPSSSVATVRVRGGGSEIYTPNPDTGLYPPEFMSQCVLVNEGSGTYQRQLPDGSVQVFDQSDSSTPPNIFMTQVIDPQGNSTLIQYDENFRITELTDAINQVSTVSYVSNTFGDSGFYNIAQITDPFGRSCSFSYDSTNTFLLSDTDVLGMTSQFVYDSSSSFITTMTTPYGSTSFNQYVPGENTGINARGLQFTFPDGTRSVLESWIGYDGHTYFWDREATQLYPADPASQNYTHCKQTRWLFNEPVTTPVTATVTYPLEQQTLYGYPNATDVEIGTSSLPSQSSQSLPIAQDITLSGTITSGDMAYVYLDGEFNDFSLSYTVQMGDTLDSVATALAAAINASSDAQINGIRATSLSNVVTTVGPSLSTLIWLAGDYLEPTIVSSNSGMQLITITGSPTPGDVATLTNQTTGAYVTYTVQSGDTLSAIATNLASNVNDDSTFQAEDISAIATSTNISLYTTSPPFDCSLSFTVFSTERATTYSFDGTAQAYYYQYNPAGNVTQSIDPTGRTLVYTYAENNIDLEQITEPLTGQVLGAWSYNDQHLPTSYTDGSAQTTYYYYNSSGQLTAVTDPLSNTTYFTYTGTDTATISGTMTTGDVLTITVHDTGLTGGEEAVSYTVLSDDTITSIAAALAGAISADSNLQAIGVWATSDSAVITMNSNSLNVTSYTESTSGGATEAIAFGTNVFGYLTQVQGPLSGSRDITTMSYDSYGRLSQVTDSEGYTIEYAYDNANRPTLTTYPDGTTETTVYYKLDAVVTTDRIGRSTQRAFDSLDRLVYEIDPLGRKTQYTWCPCGALATLTDPAGNVTSWQHDLEGRTVLKTFPDQTTISYSYDNVMGSLQAKIDALGQTTNYVYGSDSALHAVGYVNAVNPTSTVMYSYDPTFSRITSVQNGWGTISYSYNDYVTDPDGTPITGGGMLSGVTNSVIPESDITYSYDALGRTTNRSINGDSNSVTWAYDAISRITSETNPLGEFDYAYVDDASGYSRGTTRLSSISYPNGQMTYFNWFGNLGDQRLQGILNLKSDGTALSNFSYGYDSAGQITTWQQQLGPNNNQVYTLGYDPAGQLISAQSGTEGVLGPPNTSQYYYGYDPASNRTSAQTNIVQFCTLGGSTTSGDTITATVYDSGLSGGSETVSYEVQSDDDLVTAAAGLAANITSDANLQAIGVNAISFSTALNICSCSPNVTTYSLSTSDGATETMTLGTDYNSLVNATVVGTPTPGDTLTITVFDPALSGGQESVDYTVQDGDSLADIAGDLMDAINADSNLQAINVNGYYVETSGQLVSDSTNVTTYTQSTSADATENVVFSLLPNATQNAMITGSVTEGDTLYLTVYDAALTGGSEEVSYTVQPGDDQSDIANGIANQINSDAQLPYIMSGYTFGGPLVYVDSFSLNPTSYRTSVSSGATETLLVGIDTNSVQTACIGGTATEGDTVTLTANDAGLSDGLESVSYTVQPGDELDDISYGLQAAVNADTSLQNIGVSAWNTADVVFLYSQSSSQTTYNQSVSSGATETVALGTTTANTQFSYNNVNELTTTAPGGATTFQGTSNKPIQSASCSSQVISIAAEPASPTTYAQSVTCTPTETVNNSAFLSNQLPTFITFSGSATVGDTISITAFDARISTGPQTISYTVAPGDDLLSIVYQLAGAVNDNFELSNNGISADTDSDSLVISQSTAYTNTQFEGIPPSTAYTVTVNGTATETLSLGQDSNGNSTATIGGSVTVGDVLSITVENANLPDGEEAVSYTTMSGDTLSSIASSLTSTMNSDANLQGIGVSATSSSAVINIATAGITYTESTSGGATETLTVGTNNAGNCGITVGGAPTTGDTLTVTVHSAFLSGGSKDKTYSVLSTDNLVTIAAGLASALNADSDLQAIGLSATSTAPATFAYSQSFSGNAVLPSGASSASVSAIDGDSNTVTNGYSVAVNGGSGASLTYDLCGNMTSDGTNSYAWDAENRLIKITYPGSGNYTVMAYDGLGRNVLIQEYVSSSLSSEKQFVWCRNERRETRDGSGTLISQFFDLGQMDGATTHFYGPDQVSSIWLMTDNSGNVVFSCGYDPYGRAMVSIETTTPDFGYGGYYFHTRSGFCLTETRAYDSLTGRFLNRDGIGEMGGVNLFAYLDNSPLSSNDPSGYDGGVRAVDMPIGTKPANTTAPESVKSVGGDEKDFPKNPDDLANRIKSKPPCLLALCRCHGADPAKGSSEASTSYGAALARKTGCWVVACHGFYDGQTAICRKFPVEGFPRTKCTLFDPKGNPTTNYNTPMTPADWTNAEAHAFSGRFR